MAAVADDREQLVEARSRLGHLRLRRPAPAHADDHRVAVAQQAGPVPRHRGLAGALAGADHRERGAREVEWRVGRRVEAHPRCLVCEAEVQGVRGELHARARRQARARRPGRPPRTLRAASTRDRLRGSRPADHGAAVVRLAGRRARPSAPSPPRRRTPPRRARGRPRAGRAPRGPRRDGARRRSARLRGRRPRRHAHFTLARLPEQPAVLLVLERVAGRSRSAPRGRGTGTCGTR